MIVLVDETSNAVEAMLAGRSLEEVARVLAAIACVDAEEEEAVISRPTEPNFQGEPWI